MMRKLGMTGSALVAVCLLLSLAACDTGDRRQSGKARIVIAAASKSAKTILPDFPAPTAYILTVSGGPTVTAPLVNASGSFSLELEYGTYDFTIEGFGADQSTSEAATCRGSVTERMIDADASISVTLMPRYASGSGSAAVTVFWPRTIGATKAEFACLPAESEPEPSDWEEVGIDGHRSAFAKAGLASGNYDLYYRVYAGAELLVSESRSLQVAANLESSAAIGLSYRQLSPQTHLASGCATALLKADGSLWFWGYDDFSSRGIARAGNKTFFPNQLAGDDWAQVSSGYTSSAIKGDGSLWAWGDFTDAFGRAGGDLKHTPYRLGADSDWLQTDSLRYSVFAIKEDGSLWMIGNDPHAGYNGLGGITANQTSLARIGTDNDWIEVETGGTFVLGLKADGSLWAWGEDTYGQLGNGAGVASATVPTRVGTDADWASLAAGEDYSFAIKNDGRLFAWGTNSNAILGLGDYNTIRESPTQVGTDADWVQVDTGGSFAAAIKSDGSLYTWGPGPHGDGTVTGVTSPLRLGTANDWLAVVVGPSDYSALKSDGKVYTWGGNNLGQLGDGGVTERWLPGLNSLETYSLSFSLNGAPGTAPASQTLRLNDKAITPTAPSCDYHDFLGWYTDPEGTTAWDFANGLVTSDLLLYAKWNPMTFSPGLSVLLESPAEESITLGANQSLSRSASLAVGVAEDFSGYRWFIDGTRIACATAKSLELPMAGYALGKHNLTVLVLKKGLWYSKNLYFVLSE